MNLSEAKRSLIDDKAAWNEWATHLLERRAELENAGKWVSCYPRIYKEVGESEAARNWFKEADVNFRGESFGSEICDFSGLIFPGNTDFSGAKFSSEIRFDSCKFHGNVDFSGCTFEKDAYFQVAEFCSFTFFSKAKFLSLVRFERSVFRRDSFFTEVKFGDDATYTGCHFQGTVFFFKSVFDVYVDLRAIKCDHGMSLQHVTTETVPDLRQANFSEPVDFDNISILKFVERFSSGQLSEVSPKSFSLIDRLMMRVTKHAYSQNVSLRCRALRNYCRLNGDFNNEIRFFGMEVKARRFWFDSALSFNFWAGAAFDVWSRFGVSVFRPTIALLIFMLIYVLYLSTVREYGSLSYIASTLEKFPESVAFDDVRFALSNGVPLIFQSSPEAAKIYTSQFPLTLSHQFFAASAIHKILSYSSLFLLLLAIRNQFRLK